MENIHTYIESGILELYALDQLNSEEKAEVAQLLSQHSELQKELEIIENSFEDIAWKGRTNPSEKTKKAIFDSITFANDQNIQENTTTEDTKSTIIPFSHVERKLRFYKMAFASCLVLLVINMTLLYNNYNKLIDTKNELTLANASKSELVIRASKLQFNNDGLENMLAMTQSSDWKTVILKSTSRNSNSKMLVYWNDKNSEVVLNYSAMDMPNVDKGKAYQLWAIVDGKPKSLGVFNSTETATRAVINMNKVDKVQAFAVTIEPEGGSQVPTIAQMVVKGDING